MAIQGNRPNNRAILVVGVVLAVAAFAGVFLLLRNSQPAPTTVSILETTQSIPAGSNLTVADVKLVAIPQDVAPVGGLNNVSQITGKVAAATLNAGTPLTTGLVTSPGGSLSTGVLPAGSLSIPLGYVDMSIPTSESFTAAATSPLTVTGTGGDAMTDGYYITPGSHIDILVAATRGVIRWGFQDVEVVKVGDSGTAAATPSVLIVQIPRSQAELLTYLVTVTANSGCVAPTCTPANPGPPSIVKYVLRPTCEYGDLNYASQLAQIVTANEGGHNYVTVAQLQCLNPSANYESNAGPSIYQGNTQGYVENAAGKPVSFCTSIEINRGECTTSPTGLSYLTSGSNAGPPATIPALNASQQPSTPGDGGVSLGTINGLFG